LTRIAINSVFDIGSIVLDIGEYAPVVRAAYQAPQDEQLEVFHY
jgi:hypothetical protein